jgi:hypothetical protein
MVRSRPFWFLLSLCKETYLYKSASLSTMLQASRTTTLGALASVPTASTLPRVVRTASFA